MPADLTTELIRIWVQSLGGWQRSYVGSLEIRVNDLRTENLRMAEEIEAWKEASNLEDAHGDPDGVTPEAMRRHWEQIEAHALRVAKENVRLVREATRCRNRNEELEKELAEARARRDASRG